VIVVVERKDFSNKTQGLDESSLEITEDNR
jgi:hypothetical protein